MKALYTTYQKHANCGYVTIEMIIIAGLLVSLGVFSISNLQTHATEIADTSITSVEKQATNEEMWYMYRE